MSFIPPSSASLESPAISGPSAELKVPFSPRLLRSLLLDLGSLVGLLALKVRENELPKLHELLNLLLHNLIADLERLAFDHRWTAPCLAAGRGPLARSPVAHPEDLRRGAFQVSYRDWFETSPDSLETMCGRCSGIRETGCGTPHRDSPSNRRVRGHSEQRRQDGRCRPLRDRTPGTADWLCCEPCRRPSGSSAEALHPAGCTC